MIRADCRNLPAGRDWGANPSKEAGKVWDTGESCPITLHPIGRALPEPIRETQHTKEL